MKININDQYNIELGNNLFKEIKKIQNDQNDQYDKIIVLYDSNLKSYVNDFKLDCFSIEICEKNKNIDLYLQIIDIFYKYNLTKFSQVIIVGGGVLHDACSFACATYNRGISYISIPTTLLAMVDASIGSKTGINYKDKKNAIGVFSNPQKVIIDFNFLKSLPIRQINSAIAEIIKVGHLYNSDILSLLNDFTNNYEEIIYLSILAKKHYVETDPYDNGIRNNLNFGHTYGHAIESYYNYEKYTHGEAIALGMVIASNYNNKLIEMCKKFNLPTLLEPNIQIDKLIEIMFTDKKTKDNKIKIIQMNSNLEIKQIYCSKEQINEHFKFNLIIKPQVFKNEQMISVNKSKSYLHRIFFTAVALEIEINTEFSDLDMSEDILATIDVLKRIGVKINFLKDNQVYIDARVLVYNQEVLDAYKSGTTLRIMIPLLLSKFKEINVSAHPQLQNRPLCVWDQFLINDQWPRKYKLNTISDNYHLDATISSQFVSGMIYGLINSQVIKIIKLDGKIVSSGYILMTIEILNIFGVDIEFTSNQITIFPYTKKINNNLIKAEDDVSSLGYFYLYNYLLKLYSIESKLFTLPNIKKTMQPDYQLWKIIDNQSIDVSVLNCPDLFPTLCIYGLLNKQGITIRDFKHVETKESNRVLVMKENLERLGATIVQTDNQFMIKPINKLLGGKINTYGDHRIAFAFSICSSFASREIEIDDYRCVSKSFKNFYQQLNGEYNGNFR